MLRREGYHLNRQFVQRLDREEVLAVRRRKRKRVAAPRAPLPAPSKPNECWSMDFVSDALGDGRKFRALALVGDFTRECPVIEVDVSLPGARVVRVLEQLAQERGPPKAIVCDTGPEFAGQALDQWAHRHGITLAFIEPGEPVQNAYIERFNGRFRDECLNESWFVRLADARQTIEAWRLGYNETRPHGGLADRTPAEFAREWRQVTPLVDPSTGLASHPDQGWGSRQLPAPHGSVLPEHVC